MEPALFTCDDPALTKEDEDVKFRSLLDLSISFFLPSFLADLVRSLVIVVLPLYVLQLGYTHNEVGFLLGVFGVGSMLGNLPAGMLAASVGPKPVIQISFLLFIMSALLFQVATSQFIQVLGMALLGFGYATSMVGRQLYLNIAVPSEVLGRFSSTNSGVQRVAFTFGPLISGSLTHRIGIHVVFRLQIALCLVALVLTQLCMVHVGTQQHIMGHCVDVQAQKREADTSVAEMLRAQARTLVSVGLFSTCFTMVQRAREIFFALVGHALQLSQEQVGIVFAFSYGLDAFLFPVAGCLLDNFGRTRTGALSSLGLAVAVAVLCGNSPSGFRAFAGLSGVANGIGAGAQQAIGADFSPSECRGEFLAIYRTIGKTGDLLSPLLIGFLASHSSLEVAQRAMCLVGLFGAFWVSCVVARIKESDSCSGTACTLQRGISPAYRFTMMHKTFRQVDPSEGDTSIASSSWRTDFLRDASGGLSSWQAADL